MLIYLDGHMHSVRSDGSGDVAQIKETALGRGLSAVIVTDHCSDADAREVGLAGGRDEGGVGRVIPRSSRL